MSASKVTKLTRALLVIAMMGGMSARAVAQPLAIDFNDPAGLLGIPGDCARSLVCKGAPLSFANSYREHGMLFTDGVNPPDPALGAHRANHYHLSYADRAIEYDFVQGKLTPGRRTAAGFVPLTNPENERRTLSPHEPGTVIQMIYDPNNDGVPDPFNLISLVVHAGKLNVGTKSSAGISVYNNLTAGFEWMLINARNLTRATLEVPTAFGSEGIFTVDHIVFEPVSSVTGRGAMRAMPAQATSSEGQATSAPVANVLRIALEPLLFETVELASPAFGSLVVEDARVERRGPALDRFDVTGTLQPGFGSNGVVDAANRTVVVTFGDFQETVPVGLLTCTAGSTNTTCDFSGPPGGITALHIETPPASSPGPARFTVHADGLDLSHIMAEPVPIAIQIGDHLGVTSQQVPGTSP
jgi:hypothetical protein